MENQIEHLSFTSFLVDKRKLLVIRILQGFFMFWILLAFVIGCGGPYRNVSGQGIMQKIHRDKAGMIILLIIGGISVYGLIINLNQEPKKGEITLNENEIVLKIKHKETRFPIKDLKNIEFKLVFDLIKKNPYEKEDEEFSFQMGIGNYMKISYLGEEFKEEFVINNQRLYKELQAIIQVWEKDNIPVKVI